MGKLEGAQPPQIEFAQAEGWEKAVCPLGEIRKVWKSGTHRRERAEQWFEAFSLEESQRMC